MHLRGGPFALSKDKFGLAFLLGIMVISGLACGRRGERTHLQDLENALRGNPSRQEINQVLKQLQVYYTQLHVPDSLYQQFEKKVRRTINNAKSGVTVNFTAPDSGENPYALEDSLTARLRQANLARLNRKPEIFSGYMEAAKKIAAYIDAQTGVKYWTAFVNNFRSFTRKKALAWHKANIAKQGCKRWQDSSTHFTSAEYYAALALRNLQQAPDQRIFTEILQRLQYILYQHRSLFELSLALGESTEQKAREIGHHLRVMGCLYHRAEAKRRQSQFQEAISLYQKTLAYSQKHRRVKWATWFALQSRIGEGEAQIKLGNYDAAAQVADSANRYVQSYRDSTRLQLLRGDIYRCQARYEQAETELRQALARAKRRKDTFNYIVGLNNLGVLFERLGEPDLAFDAYRQAQHLFTSNSPDASTRMLVLNNMIDILVAKNDTVQLKSLARETQNLLKQAPVPFRQAQWLRNSGQEYESAGQYQQAISYYQKASEICREIGRPEFDLGTQLRIGSCLEHLSKYAEARKRVMEVETIARRDSAVERLIDAMGLLAEIQFRAGDTLGAIATSDRFLKNIDSLSALFQSPQRMMAYRQKIYGYLKDAVLYNLAAGHLRAAFSKLDYAKGYVMRHRFPGESWGDGRASRAGIPTNIDSIVAHVGDRGVLIDYLVANDSLYAFVINAHNLRCLSRHMPGKTLQAAVEAYKKKINATVEIFQNYDPERIGPHFAETVAASETLYHDLLDWPGLRGPLQHAQKLYIVPDEFLYDVPFSTLIRDRSDPASFEAGQAAITMLPAAGFIARQHAKPEFATPEKARVLLCVDRRFPQAKKFVAAVHKEFPFAEDLRAESDSVGKSTIISKLSRDYQVYIFLGHAKANPTFPEQSYFDVAVQVPKPKKQKILRISMADLRQLHQLPAEMVMLIGCETVGKKLYRGTGASGLHQGFLTLGAKNVLANLWEVDAGQAIPQAERFLETWAETRDIARALQISQLATIDALRHKRLYQAPHPYFWGSTVLLTTNPHE